MHTHSLLYSPPFCQPSSKRVAGDNLEVKSGKETNLLPGARLEYGIRVSIPSIPRKANEAINATVPITAEIDTGSSEFPPLRALTI